MNSKGHFDSKIKYDFIYFRIKFADYPDYIKLFDSVIKLCENNKKVPLETILKLKRSLKAVHLEHFRHDNNEASKITDEVYNYFSQEKGYAFKDEKMPNEFQSFIFRTVSAILSDDKNRAKEVNRHICIRDILVRFLEKRKELGPKAKSVLGIYKSVVISAYIADKVFGFNKANHPKKKWMKNPDYYQFARKAKLLATKARPELFQEFEK